MTSIFILLLGILIGSSAVYVWSRSQWKAQTQLLQAQYQAELIREKTIAEQTALSEQRIKEQFSLLATEVLNKNLESQVKTLQNQNANDLDRKKQEFNQSFEEIKTNLKSTSEKIQLFEKERTDQYAKIEKQIQTISQQEQKLIQETERLKSALTTSQSVRGRWGELVLKNILQQSGLVSGIDFEEQATTADLEGNSLKPDFVLNLPQSRQHLVIDSKASIFESYLNSETAETESERKALHADFAKRLRERVKDLASKEYQKYVSDSLPYVILFVPSEAAIRAAFDFDREIFQWSMERKVFLASPATILPLVMLIGHAWNQHRLSEKASELSMVVSQLGDRLENFVKRLSRVQGGLESATKAWNEAIDKSWNGNQSVQKSIERARELGGNLAEPPLLTALDSSPRVLE